MDFVAQEMGQNLGGVSDGTQSLYLEPGLGSMPVKTTRCWVVAWVIRLRTPGSAAQTVAIAMPAPVRPACLCGYWMRWNRSVRPIIANESSLTQANRDVPKQCTVVEL